jgi:uncharacterized protein (DUF58 family)
MRALAAAWELLLVGLVLADYLLTRSASQCEAKRYCEPYLSLGAEAQVEIRVTNPTQTFFHVQIKEEAPPTLVVESRRFRVDLPAGETAAFRYVVRPLERGDQAFGALNLRLRSTLGLIVRQSRIEASQSVRVIPNIAEAKKYQLLAKQNRLAHLGLKKSRIRGAGLEFDYLREYQPDDELRRVDWKASARRGSLVTKEYDVEKSQNVVLLLDLGRTMASRASELSKLDYAVNAAILLAYVAVRGGDKVGVVAFADDVIAYLALGKAKSQPFKVVQTVHALQPRLAEADYRRCFQFLNGRLKRRSLVALFTDVLDPDSSQRLISDVSMLTGRHLVFCVALSDYELGDLLEGIPSESAGLYEQTVALALREDRDKALAMLSAKGVLTLDAAPKDLSVAVVNQYLRIKQEGRI